MPWYTITDGSDGPDGRPVGDNAFDTITSSLYETPICSQNYGCPASYAGDGRRESAHLARSAPGAQSCSSNTRSQRTYSSSVQLAPMEGDERSVELRPKRHKPVQAKIEPASSTAHFRLEQWNPQADVPFELAFQAQRYEGTIRRNPTGKNEIVVGSLTCQGDFGFPHSEIARNVAASKPDILFFTGDQLYEANGGYSIQRRPAEDARLDYLRKWYMFGWAWGELTRHTPCVCLPDDHDVYHGNVWGAGGRRAEYPAQAEDPSAHQQAGQDSGGYTMPAPWVNIVYRTQSSHLPDPPDVSPIEQGITVHYSALRWGGIDFAILEDRKWKSAPKALLPEARIRNGWPQNPNWISAKQGDVPGAHLLGERQERFLEQWAADWPDDVEMKAVVSATIFCNLATLPHPRALCERSPGYGIVRFRKKERAIQLTAYPRWADASKGATQPFPGWPITVHQMDNGLTAAHWELRLPRRLVGLVVVTRAGEQAPVLNWRSSVMLDRIPIWSPGSYDVRIGNTYLRNIAAVNRRSA